MKTFRIPHVLLILSIATFAYTQDLDTADVYYSYELIQDKAISEEDTSYHVFIYIDSLEIIKYETLVILNADQEKVLTIKRKDLDKEKEFSLVGDSYRIDLDKWENITDWIVFGEKADKTKKYFKKLEKPKKSKVIDTPIPVKTIFKSDTILVKSKENK